MASGAPTAAAPPPAPSGGERPAALSAAELVKVAAAYASCMQPCRPAGAVSAPPHACRSVLARMHHCFLFSGQKARGRLVCCTLMCPLRSMHRGMVWPAARGRRAISAGAGPRSHQCCPPPPHTHTTGTRKCSACMIMRSLQASA